MAINVSPTPPEAPRSAVLRRTIASPRTAAVREGACGSCVCRVLDGKVDIAFSETLEAEDIDDGYILGCQARAASERVVIEF
ncbi:2Fe-2S iron-sulfur cluster-binding protein [Knoellia aerolata]|uniref:2Fe-2S iron-sulfur cluster-binding protein n=1 Tax=Knoellia aerolata TaxID=442954 RepID=UPI0009FEFF6F|nr:2Fe-2S iron-sulfur cluster binding domain-containing protein [Knoellia aerolata]